jgi:outer membrane protein assembly complex protein YaeT
MDPIGGYVRTVLVALSLLLVVGLTVPITAQDLPTGGLPGLPDQLPLLEVPEPKPRGKLAITVTGHEAFATQRVHEAIVHQIAAIEESELDEAGAHDAAFFLASFYRKQGYAEVDVSARITGAWSLLLSVQEGPRATIGRVNIVGNSAYNSLTLSRYMQEPTRKRFPKLKASTPLPFILADIDVGVDLVERAYAADGFLDAVITPAEIALRDSGAVADITLKISEGPQYRFGAVRFSGTPLYSREVLLRAVAEEVTKPFTDGRLAAAQRKLEDFYKLRGHFSARVEVAGDKNHTSGRGRVPVSFQLVPGPVFHFDGLSLHGLEHVKPEFLRNRFRKLSGEVYSPEPIDKKFRELVQTGLFRNLRISPKVLPENRIRLAIDVEEARAKEFGIGLGFATFEGALASLSYSDRNLFQSGRPLTINTEYTSRGYKGDILYSDPWLFETDYELHLHAYGLTRKLPGYSKFEYGFQPSLGRHITEHWEVSGFFLAKQVSLTEAKIAPPTLLGPGDYLANSIGLSQTFDCRNNIVNPTRGFLFTTTVDFASGMFGSDAEFVRGTCRFAYYVQVTKGSVLSLGVRGGAISTIGGIKPPPIEERFFNGGATSVRSFAERKLGPRDRNGYPIGGNAFTVFNAEYTIPIRADLKGAFFVDAGNIQPRASDFGSSGMRYGVGVGLRYNLPIGPLRVDCGLNLSRAPGESLGAFHFSIGAAF